MVDKATLTKIQSAIDRRYFKYVDIYQYIKSFHDALAPKRNMEPAEFNLFVENENAGLRDLARSVLRKYDFVGEDIFNYIFDLSRETISSLLYGLVRLYIAETMIEKCEKMLERFGENGTRGGGGFSSKETERLIDYFDADAGEDRLLRRRYFRGQTDYNYRIVPSMCRGLPGNMLLDFCGINAIYRTHSLDQKYEEHFGNDPIYGRYSFLQHACSLSPFIDLTSRAKIAATFALSNYRNFYDFEYKDSAFIVFDVINPHCKMSDLREVDKWLINNSGESPIILDEKIRLGHEYEYNIYDYDYYNGAKIKGTKRLLISTLEELVTLLTPKIKIFDIATSDRMLYQKGSFAYFYNYVCFKGFFLYELCQDVCISSHPIPRDGKQAFLNKLRAEEPDITLENLMNPYQVFHR